MHMPGACLPTHLPLPALQDTKAKLPGPGAYEAWRGDTVIRTSAPAFSLSLKNPEPGSKDRKPGPNEYLLKLDSKPGVSIKFRHPVLVGHQHVVIRYVGILVVYIINVLYFSSMACYSLNFLIFLCGL